MRYWLLLMLSFGGTYLAMPYLAKMVEHRLVRDNYRNEAIPVGLGLVFFLIPIPLILISSIFGELSPGEALLFSFALLAFGTIGFVDDTLGSREARGFSGHFNALRQGILTTGALKALFGGVVAALVALYGQGSPGEIVVNTLVIALVANLFNLLDVRPGRSGKFYIFLMGVMAVVGIVPFPNLVLLASLLAYLPWDLEARVMMGDVGANMLGAAAGLALLPLPLGWRWVVLLGLLGIHFYTETRSLTKLIEGNFVLNWLDNLGRKNS